MRRCSGSSRSLAGSRHVAPETPGSIHEGGELGYSLSMPSGRPSTPRSLGRLRRRRRRGRDRPLATSWHSNKFLNPVVDGAVLPILHLNGYKIANPTVLARIPEHELIALLRGLRLRPVDRRGRRSRADVHQRFAGVSSTTPSTRIKEIQAARAARRARATRPRWPMIVLRTPKGWTGPQEVDGLQVEGTWRSHQVPLSGVHGNDSSHRAAPRDVAAQLPPGGALRRVRQLLPSCAHFRTRIRRGATVDECDPARQRRRVAAGPAAMPDFRELRRRRRAAGHSLDRADAQARCSCCAELIVQRILDDVPALRPRRDRNSQPSRRRLRGHRRARGMRRRSRQDEGLWHRRARDGGAVRALSARAGSRATSSPAATGSSLLRGVHPHRRLHVQPAREAA